MLPQDQVNRALDQLPGANIIGSFGDGTPESEAARRAYGPSLRQLLRACHWNFIRKMAPMLLLADASGQTLDPGTGASISTAVEPPWLYCYGWPNDAVAVRWIPSQLNPSANSVPPVTNLNVAVGFNTGQRPARFLISSSDNFAAAVAGDGGPPDWDNLPDLDAIEGQGMVGRRVILTNVPPGSQGALLVYSKLALDPNEWDPFFGEAFVSVLTQRLAIPVLGKTDPKLAIAIRDRQIGIARDMLTEARLHNGNEAGYPQSFDHVPDWIRARRSSGSRSAYGYDDGPGVYGCGWDPFAFSDGSVY